MPRFSSNNHGIHFVLNIHSSDGGKTILLAPN